jgi:8-oxo-dGTP pyrophosphatase MutT (NUDIX family)
VILLRAADRDPGFEAFLLRRRRGASFMSGAFVFPGGAADPDDAELRATAARELFEEAGVLVGRGAPDADTLAGWRKRILGGEPLAPILAEHGVAFDLDAFHYYAHWITPSIEKKRFSARFYVAVLPAGQAPSFDDQETVDQAWVTPGEALARARPDDLALPPPQIRTFHELATARSIDDVVARCAARAANPHPVMPRLAPQPSGFALLLPWDPEYETAGTGDLAPIPARHPLAEGPSRFVMMEDRSWRHVYGPAGTNADS